MSRSRKTLKCAYLYPDGHGVEKWSQFVPGPDVEAEWIEVFERYGPEHVIMRGVEKDKEPNGRLFMNPGIARLIKKAKRIEVSAPSVERGSENSKKLGIAVGNVTIHLTKSPNYYDAISIAITPGILSGDLEWHDKVTETFADVEKEHTWSAYKISKVHRIKKDGDASK